MEITKSEEKRENRLENYEQGLMGFMIMKEKEWIFMSLMSLKENRREEN